MTVATQPRVIGVDLSITATAVAWPDGQVVTTGESGLTSQRLSVGERVERLRELAQRLDNLIVRSRSADFDFRSPQLIVIEDLPSARTKVDPERCYLWFETIRLIVGYGVPVLPVPPSVLKLYVTGMGDANKREVVAAVKQCFPDFEIRKTGKRGQVLTTDDDNKADAVVAMALGCHLMGHPLVDLPPRNLRALDSLALPDGVR